MLSVAIESYISLRQSLGFKLKDPARNLRAFGVYAAARGDTHVQAITAAEWATTASSPHARYVRLHDVAALARFLAAEDPAHEVPNLDGLRDPFVRPLPYIYTPDEISRLVSAAGRLRASYRLRREVYATLFGLIASTGLRISEALSLRMGDVSAEGVLSVRQTKFGKSRLVPLHPTAATALDRYLAVRRAFAAPDDHVFLSAGDHRIHSGTANYTFHQMLKLAGIGQDRKRKPRIHDLRHTFATRALERCPVDRASVGRHFVALSTYLGHVNIRHTYWYLETTPELMTGIADAVERLVNGGGQ